MRRGCTTGLVLVLLSACTRPNPVFEALTDGDPATSAVTSAGGTEGPMSGSSGGDTTRGMSGPDDGSVTRGDSGSESPPDLGPECMLQFRDPYGFTSVPPLEEMFPECPPMVHLNIVGSTTDNGMELNGDRCTSCNCDEFPISLTFEVPLIEVSGCFDLAVQLEPKTCKVLAYMLMPYGGGLPLMIVSNEVTPVFMPPFELPFEVGLGEPPSDTCVTDCEPTPGRYPLVIGDTPLPATGDAVPVEAYTVVNDDSGIDIGCDLVGRWYASRGEP